jgi:toxin ParE1/3/4
MSRYELTVKARADLRAIGRYTRLRYGREQTERYLTTFYETFRRLGIDGHLGRPTMIAPYLRIEVGRHVVFFRRQERVLIVRVLHDRMLPELHLDSEDR